MTGSQVETFSELIRGGNPVFDAADRKLIGSMYHAIIDDGPVSIDKLAEGLRRPIDAVSAALERCNVQYDDGRIVAFGGLSLTSTDHVFEVRGKRMYTWCAWDPLFIAPILGEEARVQTSCPVTGTNVTLFVGPEGIRDLSPSAAALSLRMPDESCRADTFTNFCSAVRLFASEQAARTWIDDRTDLFIVDVDTAFELGRLMIEQRAPNR